MIRINLLVPQRARYLRVRRLGRNELYGVIAIILVGGILCGVWGNRLEAQRLNLESHKQQKLNALAHVKTEMVRMQKVTDRQKDLQETVRAYQAIKSYHNVPTMVLDVVSKELSPFSLWLTHIHMDDMRILLEGEGLEKSDVPRFIKRMQTHHTFRHIQLVEIQGRTGERPSPFHFAVSMHIVPDHGYEGTI